MAWNSIAPDGTKAVSDNTPILQANTTYSETTLNVDHFWNSGTNNDGHHQFAQMPKFGGATPSDPPLATPSCDLAYYCKLRAAGQAVEPFVITSPSNAVSQLLAIRSYGVFSVDNLGNVTVAYSLNLTSIIRSSAGSFTATFASALPSANYMVLGGVVKNNSNAGINDVFCMASATTLAPVKTANMFVFNTNPLQGTTRTDPLQCWFIAFGG